MTIKEFFSFKRNRYFWLNILAMLVIVVAAMVTALQWLDTYTRHGEAVEVPDVKGMQVEQAADTFRTNGLLAEVSDSMYVKTLPAGSILDYVPGAGQRVKRGRVIRLTINTLNVPLQTVPDVADNSSLRQAEARLLASGFKLDTVRYVPGEKDWVYGVLYKNKALTIGEKIPMGATVMLEVGNGGEMPQDSLTVEGEQPMAVGNASSEEADDSWF
ncbi:MAG: PASTA domain-containing protein [Bacteroides sp.]|nr:PASTA domain-containing protein [Bacteroides sp.]